MHSSRMRTGRALTVSGGGVHPRRNFFGGKEIEKKKEKKNLETPPKNWRPHTPPPPRVDRQTPVNLLPWPNFVAASN